MNTTQQAMKTLQISKQDLEVELSTLKATLTKLKNYSGQFNKRLETYLTSKNINCSFGKYNASFEYPKMELNIHWTDPQGYPKSWTSFGVSNINELINAIFGRINRILETLNYLKQFTKKDFNDLQTRYENLEKESQSLSNTPYYIKKALGVDNIQTIYL